MKYLSDYMEEAQTKALNKAGAFFAFSQSQFNEKKVDGVKYVSLGAGLICPKDTYKKLIKEIERISEEGIKQDLTENGQDGVILRELHNHEAFYTCDIEDTVKALDGYGITREQIKEVYSASFAEVSENLL